MTESNPFLVGHLKQLRQWQEDQQVKLRQQQKEQLVYLKEQQARMQDLLIQNQIDPDSSEFKFDDSCDSHFDFDDDKTEDNLDYLQMEINLQDVHSFNDESSDDDVGIVAGQKSFSELLEEQLKNDNKENVVHPPKVKHNFLKKGQGTARFYSKSEKCMSPRKPPPIKRTTSKVLKELLNASVDSEATNMTDSSFGIKLQEVKKKQKAELAELQEFELLEEVANENSSAQSDENKQDEPDENKQKQIEKLLKDLQIDRKQLDIEKKKLKMDKQQTKVKKQEELKRNNGQLQQLQNQVRQLKEELSSKDKKCNATISRYKSRINVLESANKELKKNLENTQNMHQSVSAQLQRKERLLADALRNNKKLSQSSKKNDNAAANSEQRDKAVEANVVDNIGSSPREVPNRVTKPKDYQQCEYEDRTEWQYDDGKVEISYLNGTRKEISADGKTNTIYYYNGDVRRTMPDSTTVYYYADARTTQTTHPDGTEVLHFSNNQIEKTLPTGLKHIIYPDGGSKCIFPDGTEESVAIDGTTATVTPDGTETIKFPNGQSEIHTKQYKKREFPDGTIKTLYVDGRQETQYSNGRIRIKDPSGKVIVDHIP